MNTQELGKAFMERRKSAGITQRDLAELCDVALHTISDLESGKGNPTLAVINRISAVLGLEIVIRPRSTVLTGISS
ncbi:MAG: helix-turn-helix domain-containing protein [Verrucomicrobiales bacterium]|nr:helix-turn-helix domain-containing protein [Verrucomicrobiales bacterium]